MIFKDDIELYDYIGDVIKEYIYDWKFERNNICFFKRQYIKCTKRQMEYLEFLLEDKCDYILSKNQIKYLNNFSIKEISNLISFVKDLEIEYKFIKPLYTISATKIEGQMYYGMKIIK